MNNIFLPFFNLKPITMSSIKIIIISIILFFIQVKELNNVEYDKNLIVDEIVLDQQKENLIKAIIWVESKNGKFLYNSDSSSIGHMQIKKILVRDVNRIIGEKKYKHVDALNKRKAIEMFLIYQNYYNPDWDLEKAARIWNGGPDADRWSSTDYYWNNLVKPMYEFLMAES